MPKNHENRQISDVHNFFSTCPIKKRKYVSDSKFYELSENQHHLSDSPI